MENTEEKRTCFFCGSKELIYDGAFNLEGQAVFYWSCEECLHDILNQKVISEMMTPKEGATLH